MAEKVAVTPDKRMIIAGADQIRDRPGYVRFWTFDTGELIRSDKWTHYEMRSLLATPDSRSVMVSGRDDHTFRDGTRYILMGDITTGEYRTIRQGHDFSIDLSFTWDKQYILFGEFLWDWKEGGEPLTKRYSDPLIETRGKVILSEQHILEVTDEGFVVENFQTGEVVQKIRANDAHRYSPLKITPDGRYILSQLGNYSSNNSALALWDLEASSFVKTFDTCTEPIGSMDITADGQHAVLLTGGENSVIKVLELETGEVILSFSPEK